MKLGVKRAAALDAWQALQHRAWMVESERVTMAELVRNVNDGGHLDLLDKVAQQEREIERLRGLVAVPNGFIQGWNEAIENAYMVAKDGADAEAIRRLKI